MKNYEFGGFSLKLFQSLIYTRHGEEHPIFKVPWGTKRFFLNVLCLVVIRMYKRINYVCILFGSIYFDSL